MGKLAKQPELRKAQLRLRLIRAELNEMLDLVERFVYEGATEGGRGTQGETEPLQTALWPERHPPPPKDEDNPF